MSSDIDRVLFWTSDAASLGQWRTRERQTLAALNLLLVSMFRSRLQGTQQRGLRVLLTNILPNNLRKRIKTDLKVNLPTS